MHGLPRNVVLKIGPEVAPGENRLAALFTPPVAPSLRRSIDLGVLPSKDSAGEKLGPVPIEARLADGTVVAIVREHDEARAVSADGRDVHVYAVCEIARLLEAMLTIAEGTTMTCGGGSSPEI